VSILFFQVLMDVGLFWSRRWISTTFRWWKRGESK